MEEKCMVNDILEEIKAELTTYQNIIAETEDMRIKASNTRYKG